MRTRGGGEWWRAVGSAGDGRASERANGQLGVHGMTCSHRPRRDLGFRAYIARVFAICCNNDQLLSARPLDSESRTRLPQHHSLDN